MRRFPTRACTHARMADTGPPNAATRGAVCVPVCRLPSPVCSLNYTQTREVTVSGTNLKAWLRKISFLCIYLLSASPAFRPTRAIVSACAAQVTKLGLHDGRGMMITAIPRNTTLSFRVRRGRIMSPIWQFEQPAAGSDSIGGANSMLYHEMDEPPPAPPPSGPPPPC